MKKAKEVRSGFRGLFKMIYGPSTKKGSNAEHGSL